MPVNQDAIGAHGEAIVTVELIRRHGRNEPFFRPQFLGEKYPAIDFFVELIGADGDLTPFFLAQVKTTSTGYTRSGRLNARATPPMMTNLMRYPAPSYLIGVDEDAGRAFIVPAITGGPTRYRSLPNDYPLADRVTLQSLYDEVRAFWIAHGVAFRRSAFS